MNEFKEACLNFLPIYGVKGGNVSNYKFLVHVLHHLVLKIKPVLSIVYNATEP